MPISPATGNRAARGCFENLRPGQASARLAEEAEHAHKDVPQREHSGCLVNATGPVYVGQMSRGSQQMLTPPRRQRPRYIIEKSRIRFDGPLAALLVEEAVTHAYLAV